MNPETLSYLILEPDPRRSQLRKITFKWVVPLILSNHGDRWNLNLSVLPNHCPLPERSYILFTNRQFAIP